MEEELECDGGEETPGLALSVPAVGRLLVLLVGGGARARGLGPFVLAIFEVG